MRKGRTPSKSEPVTGLALFFPYASPSGKAEGSADFVARQIWWQSFVSNVCTHSALQISRVQSDNLHLVNSRIKTVLLLVFVEFFWELPSLASRQPGTSGSTTGQTRSVFLVAAENVDAGTWIVPILPVVLPAMLGCVASTNLSHWAIYHGGSWQVFVVCSWEFDEFVYVCHHEYCLLISVWYIILSCWISVCIITWWPRYSTSSGSTMTTGIVDLLRRAIRRSSSNSSSGKILTVKLRSLRHQALRKAVTSVVRWKIDKHQALQELKQLRIRYKLFGWRMTEE